MSRKKTHKQSFFLFANHINKIIDDYCHGDKKEFAKEINVHYDTVRRWAKGKNLPEGGDLLHLKLPLSGI
jgi:DNA-binding transcriptional regulator YiaG